VLFAIAICVAINPKNWGFLLRKRLWYVFYINCWKF